MIDKVLLALIIQTTGLIVTALLVFYQVRNLRKTSRASFQHEIFRGLIQQRTDVLVETPDILAASPAIARLIKLAGDSPQQLARIRGMQDFFYDAYRLYKANLIDKEIWTTLEYQIISNWQSQSVSGVWDVVCHSGSYSADFIQLVDNLTKIKS
jgi:hypothetical protein